MSKARRSARPAARSAPRSAGRSAASAARRTDTKRAAAPAAEADPRFPVYVGLDLHGTLLDKRERIPARYVRPLARRLRAMRPWARLYVCTGNDMSFVREVVPAEVRRALHGYILETGASVLEGGEERPLTDARTQREVAHLRKALEEADLPGVKHFARRLTSVSVFTQKPYTRDPPAALVPAVQRIVQREGLASRFDVKFSSVAVDVVPRGFHKDRGLRAVAGKHRTVAIADSQNDWEFLLHSDYAFLPRNASPEVLRILEEHGKPVRPLARRKTGWHRGVALRAANIQTKGVLESLEFLAAAFAQSSARAPAARPPRSAPHGARRPASKRL